MLLLDSVCNVISLLFSVSAEMQRAWMCDAKRCTYSISWDSINITTVAIISQAEPLALSCGWEDLAIARLSPRHVTSGSKHLLFIVNSRHTHTTCVKFKAQGQNLRRRRSRQVCLTVLFNLRRRIEKYFCHESNCWKTPENCTVCCELCNLLPVGM